MNFEMHLLSTQSEFFDVIWGTSSDRSRAFVGGDGIMIPAAEPRSSRLTAEAQNAKLQMEAIFSTHTPLYSIQISAAPSLG